MNAASCGLHGVHLIEASAGTGKTWTLCGLYLRLLLERELSVSQILVVTFTNAATAELRERIRTRLLRALEWLEYAPPDTDPFIVTCLSTLIEHGRSATSLRDALQGALQCFDEAAIFTIHGFCQRALSEASFSAGMPLSQELLRDDAALRAEVVHDFWRQHVAHCPDTDLVAWLSTCGDSPERLATLLKHRLSRPMSTLLWPPDAPAAPFGAPERAELSALHEQARYTWQTERAAILKCITESLPRLNARSYSEASVATAARQWDHAMTTADPLAWPASLDKLKLFSSERLIQKKGQPAPSPHRFFDEATQLLQALDHARASLSQRRLGLFRTLLESAPQAVRALKRERRVIAFDDMLSNLHERLNSPQYPTLAGALAERFPVALIDEFQDTDPLQWAIFRSIWRQDDASVFLIGDPKQAIYSFRNADLHTYLQARAHARAVFTLTDNQRSCPALLNALNPLFGANPRAFMLDGLNYHPVGLGAHTRRPFQDVRPFAMPDRVARAPTRAAMQVWTLPGEHEGGRLDKSTARQAVVSACATEILDLLYGAQQGQVQYDNRALQGGDIAVLVRSHSQGLQMRQALAAVGVGSVELSQASVFQSPDAEGLEQVLSAVLEPRRDGLLRAALATDLIGLSARDVDDLSHDTAALAGHITRFSDWRLMWFERGIGVMLRQLMDQMRVSQRMLARDDGERRLTNLSHLTELLHEAAAEHPAPDALLRWLQTRRSLDDAGDAAQLRLESDRNLVQILTVHRSKGLEFPVVFCPFLWDAGQIAPQTPPLGHAYHDATGQPVWDLREEALDKTEADAIKQAIRLESAAEDMRLIYVALTRAVHRCYLVTGLFRIRTSTSSSRRTLLHWLVAGGALPPADWLEHDLSEDQIMSAWAQWATDCAPDVSLTPLPGPRDTHSTMPLRLHHPTTPQVVAARPAPASLPRAWRLGSYSSLAYGARHEASAVDHDSRQAQADAASDDGPFTTDPAMDPAPDILQFPRGAAAGDCLHDVFERIDFTRRDEWPAAIDAALLRYPPGARTAQEVALLPTMVAGMLNDVLHTPILPGLMLSNISRTRRLVELEFALPAKTLQAQALTALLKAHGYGMPSFAFGSLQGYLRGFIDLVFEHQGRFHVLDWKSNHLGMHRRDYESAQLEQAMTAHGYHLQALLYVLALHRYLAGRMPHYAYDTHMGEVCYLFVRGVRPTWRLPDGRACGVHATRPPLSLIEALGQIIDGSGPSA